MREKVAVVTGAGSGIGRGIALGFAAEGARVLVTDLDPERAGDTVRRIGAGAGEAAALRLDVTARADHEAALAAAIACFGRVDIWVNNAGVSRLAPYLELEDGDWETVLDTNLRGAHLGTQVVARHWVALGRKGRIVNVGSIDAEVTYPHNVAYCVSKAGLRMLTKAAALALAAHGITVNEIAPGITDTEMIARRTRDLSWMAGVQRRVPAGRLARVEDVAAAAVFLASDEANYVTGASLNVDGAQSIGADWALSQWQAAGSPSTEN
jgi:glucose 1-dehydrogenase